MTGGEYQRLRFLQDALFTPFNVPPPFDLFDFLVTCLALVELQHLQRVEYDHGYGPITDWTDVLP